MKALSCFAAFLMCLLLLYQSAGHFLVLKAEHYFIKREIKCRLKSGVPEGELISFSFSRQEVNSLQWIKKNKEFVHKGKMYDVVHQWHEQDRFLMKCIDDQQETRLFRKLDLLAQFDLGAKPNRHALMEIHFSINRGYFAQDFRFEPFLFWQERYIISDHLSAECPSRTIEPVVPPPKA